METKGAARVDEHEPAEVINLRERIAAGGSGAILSRETSDLDLNLVRFDAGAGVAAHVNREVDVVVVAVDGEGVLTIDGSEQPLAAGQVAVIPKGVERAIRAGEGTPFAYLTLHRRRARLWPSPPTRKRD